MKNCDDKKKIAADRLRSKAEAVLQAKPNRLQPLQSPEKMKRVVSTVTKSVRGAGKGRIKTKDEAATDSSV